MKYWRIEFIDGDRQGTYGFLVLSDELNDAILKDEGGADVVEGVSYRPVDTEAAPPDWA